jgi:Transglutaminase-like superfamily
MRLSSRIPSPAGLWLHLRALALVGTVRVALWLAPSRAVLSTVTRSVARRRARRQRTAITPRRVVAAVVRVSRVVPTATCLTQALAGQALLASYGHDARLKVGVARDDAGAFSAHAWLELDATPILGERGIEQFTPMPDLQRVIE